MTDKELQNEIDSLPRGYISKKKINGKAQYYRQWKENGKVKSQYVKASELADLLVRIERRNELIAELNKRNEDAEFKRIKAYADQMYATMNENVDKRLARIYKQTSSHNKSKQKKQRLEWHPGFCAAIRLDLREYSDILAFEDELSLTEGSLRIDSLVIKKRNNVEIENDIARNFSKYNIIEYKSPDDRLSIDDFYKTIAYACLFKSGCTQTEKISPDEITMTLIKASKPRALLNELMELGYQIKNTSSGVYEIEGKTPFFAQVIVTNELEQGSNIEIKSLTKNISKLQFNEYKEHYELLNYKEKEIADIVLDLICKGNRKKVDEWKKEDDKMCDTLREIMADEIAEGRAEGRVEGRVLTIIEFGRELKFSKADIIDRIIASLDIDADAAEKYYNEFA